MNKTELVRVSDCSVLEAVNRLELGFREKIELCRLIDKMGVSSINLFPISYKKTDRLLVKSICSAVRNAMVAVPVDLQDPELIHIAWEALQEAASPRLQVLAPVSSVQMEYLLHMKPNAVTEAVTNTISECRKLTEEVEFIAKDATRSDLSFLCQILGAAVEAGATTVTLCDTAGAMMPDEISAWIESITDRLPSLANVTLGFFCSGELNLADACTLSAVRSGVREVKATACSSSAASLANIVRILGIKGAAIGVHTQVGPEQLRRITAQVDMICHPSGHKNMMPDQNADSRDSDLVLSIHDSMDTLLRAAESLGYDLNPEDQQKVWDYFCQTAEKKGHITLKELDAIIAAEAMQVPPAYHDIRYVINTGNQIGAMAQMKLMFHGDEIVGIASGDGAIDAAFNSIEQATGRHFELDDFQIRSISEGREAMGETVVRLRWEGKLHSGRGISTDIVGAGIMAYINALNKIVYEEEEA